jgi:hypothetical protein
MKKRYFLPLLQAACFMSISLLLQNCGGSTNLPLQEEEREPTEIQLATIGAESEQAATSLPVLMPELWQYIFSHLNFKGVLAARAVSSDWNKLITGFRGIGVVGVENKPIHTINTSLWAKKNKIDFYWNYKLRTIKPETIPSFAFYHLIGQVGSLGKEFWPYLQGTSIHKVNFRHSAIGGAEGAIEFAKHLQGTQVHTVDLHGNKIGDQGAEGFAKHLQGTQVHTVDLSNNRIRRRRAC